MKLDTPVLPCFRRIGYRRFVLMFGAAVLASLSAMSCGHFDFGTFSPGVPADAPPDSGGIVPDADPPPDGGRPAGPTLVQHMTGNMVLSNAPWTVPLVVTLPHPTSPGNLLILTGADTAGTITTVAGAGVTWKNAIVSDMFNNAEIWYGVAPPGFDGVVKISSDAVPQSSNDAAFRMILMEWSGLATSPDLLDVAGKGAGNSGSTASAMQITTANAIDLLVFDVSVDTPVFGPLPDWSLIDTVTIPGNSTERAWYLVTSSPGSFHPMVPENGTQWDTAVAAFKAAP